MSGPPAGGALPEDARVCVVLHVGIGDAVQALPVLNAIRRAAPACRITCVDAPIAAGLLRGHEAVDRVVTFDRHGGVRTLRALRAELRAERYDVTLNLNTYFKGALATLLTRAPVRVGFRRGIARDGAWLSCNVYTDARRRKHTQDLYLDFLDVLDVPREPVEWRLTPSDEERAAQAEFFAPYAGRPIAAVVPASSKLRKDWLPERIIELVDRLDRECGLTPMLLGGPGAREVALARMVQEAALTDVIWAMGDGVRRLVWRIAGCRLIIAPDTGAIHIARGLGVPAIGLYGHTNPWRVGPWRAYEDLWIDRYTEPGAAPDPGNFQPKHGRMERITTDHVIAKVQHALAHYPVPA